MLSVEFTRDVAYTWIINGHAIYANVYVNNKRNHSNDLYFVLSGAFGISRILMGTSDMATTFTGTPYYMSPEVLKHEGYKYKSDIWYD